MFCRHLWTPLLPPRRLPASWEKRCAILDRATDRPMDRTTVRASNRVPVTIDHSRVRIIVNINRLQPAAVATRPTSDLSAVWGLHSDSFSSIPVRADSSSWKYEFVFEKYCSETRCSLQKAFSNREIHQKKARSGAKPPTVHAGIAESSNPQKRSRRYRRRLTAKEEKRNDCSIVAKFSRIEREIK